MAEKGSKIGYLLSKNEERTMGTAMLIFFTAGIALAFSPWFGKKEK